MVQPWVCIVLANLVAQAPVAKSDPAQEQAVRSKRERLLEIYVNDAAGYTIYRDASRKQSGRAAARPGLRVDQPGPEDGQDGAVYRVDLPGPRRGSRQHLFDARRRGGVQAVPRVSFTLLSVLDVERCRDSHMDVDAPGTGHRDRPDRGCARSRPIRLRTGSRRCARSTHDFAASTKDHQERRWELRLLASAPLSLREHRSRRSWMVLSSHSSLRPGPIPRHSS